MGLRSLLVVLVAVLGCAVGCTPAVQRASLTQVFPEVKMDPRGEPASEGGANARSRKLVFHSPHARVHVFSNDLLNGDHHLLFSPIRGTYLVDQASGRARLHMEIGMRALQAESEWIRNFAGRMLEVDGHTKTIIDAKVEPIEGERDKRLVTGNVLLRGVERGIRFSAEVANERDGVRFHAVFDMSRSAFGIRAGPGEGDALIRDDFTVTLDFHATPEHIRAEEVDAPTIDHDVEGPLDDDVIVP